MRIGVAIVVLTTLGNTFSEVVRQSLCSFVSDPRVLNTAMENALHWACKSEEENEELVEKFLLPRLKQK